jgi:uncharacterized membrane-anchored protein
MTAPSGNAKTPSTWFNGSKTQGPVTVSGLSRGNERTKDLANMLQPGEIAVIDHLDLDRVAAESLVASGIVGVLNASASSSGRYPNEGPLVLLDAGIQILDCLGDGLIEAIPDGSLVRIEGEDLYVDDTLVRSGTRETHDTIHEIHERSRANLGAEFIRFVENTVGYLEDNQDLLSDDLDVPEIGIDFTDRHVLIVVRGHDYREDLQLLTASGYVSEQRPLLMGVDGGADALLEMGMTPDVIVGDFDSVSEKALRSGAKLVVHAFRDGRAPGAARLDELGLEYVLFKASGTSEDIAMLMAFQRGASLIVAVGTHTSMVDFLDKGRSGMASTFLTRMKVGPILVDAKGVSRLYHVGVRKRDLAILFLGAILVIAAIIIISDPVRLVIHSIWSDLTG